MSLYYIPPKGFFIGSFEISFYGVIMAVSMLLAVLLACRLCKKRGLKSDDILLLAIIVLPFAIIGARLYYCIFYTHHYTLSELFNFRSGGMAVLGGVIGGAIGVLIYCLITKKNFIIIADVVVAPLLLGQATGRIGCFFAGCCYGIEVTNPSLMWFPLSCLIDGVWHYSTFFYESLWNAIGTIVLIVVYHKSKCKGTTMACYFTWYGIGRAIIEGFRGDSLYIGATNIRVSQLLSVVLVVLGISILVYNIIRRKKTNG